MGRFYLKQAIIYVVGISILIILLKFYYNQSKQAKSYKVEDIFSTSVHYIINSSECKIPNLNPVDMSVLHLIKKIKRAECAKYPPLTKVTYKTSTEKHTLEVDYSALSYYTNSSQINCCVKKPHVYAPHVWFDPCQRFRDSFVMDVENEFVFVDCLDEIGNIIYQNMHATTPKINKFIRKRKKVSSKLNVLLIGIDSMSRLNFHRTMPKTATYLHTSGWVEMRGYNKIADNTLPNIMAFLTGLSPEKFRRAHRLLFDDMPFIWKEFSSAGYVTAYAEDMSLISTFHCHLQGFMNCPTDHYFRDYMYAGEQLLMEDGRPPGCIAYKSATEHIFDYLLDFVTVYKKYSFFGLFWLNELSHNNLNRASGEDYHMSKLLEQLRVSGTMNSTMVILLSDHGLRVGDFRKSKHGWYEDRLPLLFIWIPEWYKNQHDLHYMSLLKNSERLSSPYDIYLTMKHVLYGRSIKTSPALGCKSCHSLLTEVPLHRSCQEAGISPHWCSCSPILDVRNSDLAFSVANHVVETINQKVASDDDVNPYFLCEQLKLRNVLYLREKCLPEVKELVVGFVTDPGGAEFEGTVIVHEHYIVVEDSISRLNDYSDESSCANNPMSKLFCFCKPVQFEPI